MPPTTTARLDAASDPWFRVSPENVRAMFEAMPDAVLLIGEDGRFVAANAAAGGLLGVPREELIGRRVEDFAEPSFDVAAARARFRDRGAERGSITTVRPGGGVRDVEYTAVARAFGGYHVVVCRDVTEQRSTELALREREDRYRFLIEHTNDVITMLDTDLRIAYQSPSITAVLGYDPEELLGVPAIELVHPDDRQAVAEALVEALARDGSTALLEYRFRHKDGSWRTLEGHGMRSTTDRDRIAGVVSSRDVTERKAAELALGSARDGFRAIFEGSPLAILALDPSYRVSMWNPAAERIFGWTADEVIGRPVPYVPPEEREEFEARVERILAGHAVPAFEVPRLSKDGLRLEVRISTSLLLGPDGVVSGVVGVLEDVTERRGEQARLEQTLADLRAAMHERRRMAARIVTAQEEERRRIAGDIHDDSIQIMAATAMRLHMLRRQAPDAGNELDHLQETVQDAMGRLRRLLFELRPATLDREGLAAAVRIAMEELQKGSGIRVTLRSDLVDEPPEEVRATLYRILIEAFANVRKHSRASTVDVVLAGSRGGVVATVTDDGRGFEPEHVDGSAPGHLGLTSMRERAEVVGGTVTIRSSPGEGTTVVAWVPGSAFSAA